MAKANKGIWSYIIRRDRSAYWWFQKRYPVDVAAKIGRTFHRESLKTTDDELAERTARNCLLAFEALVSCVRNDMPFYDLRSKKLLGELTDAERAALDLILTFPDEISLKSGGFPQIFSGLVEIYQDLKNDDPRNIFSKIAYDSGVVLYSDTEIFKVYSELFKNKVLGTFARGIRHHNIASAELLEVDDLVKFEDTVFEKAPDRKVAHPTPRIIAFWEKEYATDHFKSQPNGKPSDEEARFKGIVTLFSNFTSDDFVNHVKTRDVQDFFIKAENYPVKPTDAQKKLSFKDLVGSEHGSETISETTSAEWFVRLKRFFGYAVLRYKDSHRISNPFDGLSKKKTVRGRKKIKKRAFNAEEINALYTQPEFRDFDPDKSWGWLMVALVHHGNRLSEFANRKVEEVKRDAKTGIWYIDVTEGKNEGAERQIPIHKYLIELGFLKFVKMREVAGETYLFPEEADGDPNSDAFSRKFGRWQRARGLWKAETTLHNLRSTWITASEQAKVREAVAERIVGHMRGDSHNDRYKDIYLHTMKEAMDTIKIDGFPYELIKVR
jgi:integrase